MTRLFKRLSHKAALKPGTIVYVGEKRVEPATIDIIDYSDKELRELGSVSVEDSVAYKDTSTITWINVNGIHDTHLLEQIGRGFGLHPLVLEDIANTGHRPKLEDAEEHIFLTLKMLSVGTDDDEIVSEQVSIVFGDSYVLSFQERAGDILAPIRDRLRRTIPRVRFMHADYLAYAIVDAIVDHYFVVLEHLGERLESLEDELISNPTPTSLETIHYLKRELVFMRRATWPLREVIGGMERLETRLFHDVTRPYLRDLYEHTIQVIDSVETYRDMTSGLLDIYLSSVSNRMNEVMKVLTIIATLFIPLGFLAGVYGMNFDTAASPFNLPELSLKYGYPLFWLLVLIIGGGLFWFFRRKRWL